MIVLPATVFLLISRVHASGILSAMCLSMVFRSDECVIQCLPVSRRELQGGGRPSHGCHHVQAIRVHVGCYTTNALVFSFFMRSGDSSVGARGCVPASWLWTSIITVGSPQQWVVQVVGPAD